MITRANLAEAIDMQKGLTDLLYASAAQVEEGCVLRVEGAMLLAETAANIEKMLVSIFEAEGGNIA